MFEGFQIGPFNIWTHLIFLLIGLWLSAEFFFRLAQSAGLSLQHFRDHGLWHLLAIIVGGRLIAVIGQYQVYIRPDDPLRAFYLQDGNFSFLGAAAGIACVLYFTRGTSRTTFLQWLDVLLPATCFGLSFDWLGKFAAGQAYGVPTDVFWAVTYDAPNVRFAVPIHPVQLYYALFYFILTFVLLVVRKHAKRAGAETLVGIVLASVATFIFESFRGDFSIPVFATQLDFVVLLLIFISLGIFALISERLSPRAALVAEIVGTVLCAAYIFARPLFPFDTFELRFSQLIAILALLASVVYVVVHRQRHPHL
ncbi:MAG TPA: prolipoprotein diacylglyceryl transferase family protein [Candidatus Peribacteraceae bacterium]|nr:prolipoprotein diacylglyceryl transferase family protein [Candidatus Peribacteraceae bacterium]